MMYIKVEPILWDISIQVTAPFGYTTFGPRKMLTQSLYLFPLVKGHFYSWERVSFSILDSTSIQGTP